MTHVIPDPLPRLPAKVQLSGEMRLLELVALGTALSQLATALSTFVESNWSRGCRCGLFLVDLGDFDGGRRIAHYGVLSTQIQARDGEVLGILVVDCPEPMHPTTRQRELIGKVTQLARIAVERARSEAALKRSEAALAQLRAELAHVSRVACLGALAASISHEVNQPLSAVVANAGLSFDFLSQQPANLEAARDAARRTVRDANRASEVVTKLRAMFHRHEVGNDSIDLSEAAREVIAVCAPEMQRNGVIVETNFADELPRVSGDRVQLQQVMLNLLHNAAESMLAVDDRPRVVTLSTTREEGAVSLAVSDRGTGIDPQAMDRLFQPFFSTKGAGMGIGLFVSRTIVENHRGRFQVTSNEGPGTTFSFRVPQERRSRVVCTQTPDRRGERDIALA